MEEDPLIPLVHVWNNAAFDEFSSSASAWHTHGSTPARPTRKDNRRLEPVSVGAGFDNSSSSATLATATRKGDKENQRPEADAIVGASADVDAEIVHIEAEILRLSSRLHHLRTSREIKPKQYAAAATGGVAAKARSAAMSRRFSVGPMDVVGAANPNLLPEKQPALAAQRLKQPTKQPQAPRARGLSLGPLDIAAANPKVPALQRQQGAVASRILKPITEPPVQRRRAVSLGPMEIHHGVGGKPVTARVKPFANKLNSIREEAKSSKQSAVPAKPWPSSNARQPMDAKQGAAASRAKARSASMSPRARRQSIAKATDARGGTTAVGADGLTAKGVLSHTGNASIVKRPPGSSKVRVVPSRYSLTPGASLGAGTQEKRRKQSLPGSAAGANQSEEIRAMPMERLNDELSPETIDKVAELLPRIRTIPPPEDTPRDSGCAKRVADLVGKRSFFTPAAGDDNGVLSYQARVLEVEAPEATAAEA